MSLYKGSVLVKESGGCPLESGTVLSFPDCGKKGPSPLSTLLRGCMPMRNIMLTIEYDGTNYSGWQYQYNAPSVQEEIEKALKKLTGEGIRINGAGRTDAKVHARGQVANFYTHATIPPERFSKALNSLLPDEISIVASQEVTADFHARYSAIGKRYVYQIYLGKNRSPLLRNYSLHVSYDVDLGIMKEASKLLLGTHDFAGFMSSGSSVQNTTRTIHSIEFELLNNSLWIAFEGNGFLYNMVRIIVGTLLKIGRGSMEPEKLSRMLKEKDRSVGGPTAQPQGLYLEKVLYSNKNP